MTVRPVHDAIVSALAVVSHFEDKATGRKISIAEAKLLPRDSVRSVGLSYTEVLKRVKERVPWSKASGVFLRVVAHQIRTNTLGYEDCELPQIRPRKSLQ